jgi:hypothetical protein
MLYGGIPNPDKPELKIEDLWYRFALSFLLKSIAFLSEPEAKIFKLAMA